MRFNHLTNKDNKEAVDIHIYGVIGVDEARWNEGTNNTAYALVSLIRRLEKNYSRINVHISSPGGLIDDGLAIYNALKNSTAEIHTYNDGLVASMAGIIMLAGTSHYPKTSLHHLHRASTIAIGNVNDFQDTIKELEAFESILIEAIAEKTGMEAKAVFNKWFKDGKDHYLSAEEANEIGFVDEMIETTVKVPDNITNMDYQQLVNFFTEEEKQALQPEQKGLLKRVAQLFTDNNKTTNDNSKLNKKMAITLKKAYAHLLAFLALSEFTTNEAGNVELTPDQLFDVNSELEKRQNRINELEAQLAEKKQEADNLAEKVLNLDSKLASTTSTTPANPVSGDVTPKSDKKTVDAADRLKVREYLKNNLR